jgi:hypothetical protein
VIPTANGRTFKSLRIRIKDEEGVVVKEASVREGGFSNAACLQLQTAGVDHQ